MIFRLFLKIISNITYYNYVIKNVVKKTEKHCSINAQQKKPACRKKPLDSVWFREETGNRNSNHTSRFSLPPKIRNDSPLERKKTAPALRVGRHLFLLRSHARCPAARLTSEPALEPSPSSLAISQCLSASFRTRFGPPFGPLSHPRLRYRVY